MHQHDPRIYFTQYLQTRGLRKTPERFAVLDAVLTMKGHFDADQLYLHMREEGSRVSRATVYSTIDRLTDSGLLARYRFRGKQARYEMMLGTDQHHHLICEVCGSISEFIDKRVDRLARDAARTMEFSMHDAALHIIGLCPACAAKRREVTP